MGGKSDTPPTQTTTQMLSPEQREMMALAMPGVKDFAANVPERYGASTITPFNTTQQAAQSQALGAAGVQSGLAGQAAQASQQLMNNPWDPETNPNLQGAIRAATRPITENLMNDIMPGIRTDAITRGGFGGSRQGIAEGLAAGKASQAVGDASSKLVTGVYDTNVNAALKALGLTPQTQQAQTAGAGTTSAVGDVQQGMSQSMLSEDVGNFNYEQLAPFLQSKEIMALLQGMPGGSTQTVGSLAPQPSMFAKGASGALAGASLGSALMPGVGTAAGAGIGSILPFLLG